MAETSSSKEHKLEAILEMANSKRQPLRILQCLVCGTKFQPARRGQAYCSKICGDRFNYQRNRTKRLAYARSREDAQRQYVSRDKLEACREDPRKARTIAGPDVIVCLECGEKLKDLGNHVNSKHGMTAAEYKRKPAPGGQIPRYNVRSPLSSTNLHDSRSKKAKSLRTVDQLAGHVSPDQLRSHSPQKISLESRLNRSDAMKGKAQPKLWKRTPEGKVATDASIAKLRLKGMKGKDIAQRVGIKGGGVSIRVRLHKMGFPPGRPCLFRYGEPITGKHFRDLCSDFGMTRKELAEKMHMSYANQWGQWSCSDQPLPVRFAKKVLKVRQKLADQYRHKGATKKGGRPPRIFPSQKISICASYKELIHDLKILQNWLKQGKDVPISMVWTWLCERSRDGTIRLLFWPEFLKWVTTDSYIDTKQLNHHSGGKLTETYTLPQVLAQNFLAKSYSVSEEKIRHTLKQGSPKQQAKKRLLEGALTVFNGQDKMSSVELVSAMKESDRSNWKDLTPKVLAGLLRPSVKVLAVRLPGGRVAKGYKRKDLERALRSIALP